MRSRLSSLLRAATAELQAWPSENVFSVRNTVAIDINPAHPAELLDFQG